MTPSHPENKITPRLSYLFSIYPCREANTACLGIPLHDKYTEGDTVATQAEMTTSNFLVSEILFSEIPHYPDHHLHLGFKTVTRWVPDKGVYLALNLNFDA